MELNMRDLLWKRTVKTLCYSRVSFLNVLGRLTNCLNKEHMPRTPAGNAMIAREKTALSVAIIKE